jgi:hypothetical protein
VVLLDSAGVAVVDGEPEALVVLVGPGTTVVTTGSSVATGTVDAAGASEASVIGPSVPPHATRASARARRGSVRVVGERCTPPV